MIRVGAEVDDLIFGFTANSLDRRNRLIYVALITKKPLKGEYYECDQFTARDDCIYEFRKGRYVRRKNAKFHNSPDDLTHDLGEHPEYPRADVLVSTDFRYFGVNGTDEYKSKYDLVRKAVESLGRGQRVNLAPQLREQFLAMKKSLWGKSEIKVLGRPTDEPSSAAVIDPDIAEW
jgi:putative DNA base modification enzyme with NMAD domain